MATTSATTRDRTLPFDPEDPEYIKELQRPAVIKEDLSEMERRKRVQEILESRDFCKELEDVIKQEIEGSRHFSEDLKSASLARLSELALPRSPLRTLHGLAPSTLPISDLRGNDQFPKSERVLRNKLASLYRLVDLFQWSQGIYNHITVRNAPSCDELLTNPFGLLYHEITASTLLKLNLEGEIIAQGSTKLGINETAFSLHAALHAARSDLSCIIHMHNAVVSAVSSMKCGLLPICQEAMAIGPLAYHDYKGTLDDESERASIVESLGDKNVMIIRNHGFVACGSSVEHALLLAYNTIIACETQIRAARAGIENLHIPDEATIKKAFLAARQGISMSRSPSRNNNSTAPVLEWRIGELEWEAWMRVLDNAGFQTGHLYRQPLIRNRSPSSNSRPVNACTDVACPPASTSFGSIDETDPEALQAHRVAMLRREQEKVRWLNSPNNYQKIKVLETGTDHPKVITKWIPDMTNSFPNGTAIKIDSPQHFSPISANPKEFKEKQQLIKDNRRAGVTSAGPQSQVLEGVTYEDLRNARPINIDGDEIVGPADRFVLIGTASKGIIDRNYQHNAQVYRQLYAPNPFTAETDEDIQKYMHEVELKSPRSQSGRGAPSRDGGYSTYRSETPDDLRARTPASPDLEKPRALDNNSVSLIDGARELRVKEDIALIGNSSINSKPPTIETGREKREQIRERARSAPRSYRNASPSSSPLARADSRRNRHSAHSDVTLSEDESPTEEKKKKRSFFSFMRRNKTDSKQKNSK